MTTSGNPNSRTIRLADKSPTQRKTRQSRESVMNARVYVLVDVLQGELAEVVRTLRGRPGVAMIDVVEGPPDIIMSLLLTSVDKAKGFSVVIDDDNNVSLLKLGKPVARFSAIVNEEVILAFLKLIGDSGQNDDKQVGAK